ncbi:MAG: zinc ribbon domain-containing protein [Desulfobulbaceae bacterium]|jgi:putative FmdB family regulatory protein|nr:zinc ribbon domain-containing protein [Desulfobulbaceae bacterium]
MPIYEFKCRDCNKKFETILTSSAKVSTVICPECKSKNIMKTISSSSYRLSTSSSGIPSGALSGCSSKGGFS